MKIKFFTIALTILIITSCHKEKEPLLFTGNITQVGVCDPMIVEFENTIGETSIERIEKGYYLMTLPISPNVDDVWLSINNQSIGGGDNPTIRTNGSGKILFESYYQGQHFDDMLVNNPFEIKIYNQ